MDRHKKCKLKVKIDNFPQEGLSITGEVLRSVLVEKNLPQRMISKFYIPIPNLLEFYNAQEICPENL